MLTELSLSTLTTEDILTPRATFHVARVLITPSMAKEIIAEANTRNRTASTATVKAYAGDIVAGRWAFNGASISFDTNGKLLDGQHRLMAIQEAKMDVQMMVYTGLPTTVQDTIDGNRVRSAADQLNIGSNDKNGIKVVAALRALGIMANGIGAGGRMTTPALLEMLKRHPLIAESVDTVKVGKDESLVLKPGIVAALHYAAKNLLGQPEKADQMVMVLKSGAPMQTGDAFHALREKAIKMDKAGKRLGEAPTMRGVLYAWSLFSKGEPAPKGFTIPDSITLEGLTRQMVYGGSAEEVQTSAPIPDASVAAPKAKAKGKPTKKGTPAPDPKLLPTEAPAETQPEATPPQATGNTPAPSTEPKPEPDTSTPIPDDMLAIAKASAAAEREAAVAKRDAHSKKG